MTLLKRGAFAFVLASSAVVLANCAGGGGSASGSSGGPGPLPVPGQTASSTLPPTASPAATPSPTASPAHTTGKPTATPTSTPTASPNPSPSQSPSPGPTATPACSAPTDPNTLSQYLNGSQQTFDMPCFGDFRANLTLPQNNSGPSSPIYLALQGSTDNTLGAPSGTGTPLFYESLQPDASLTLFGTVVTAHISSATLITTGHTYAATLFVGGVTPFTVTGLVPSGNNLVIPFTLPTNTTFSSGSTSQIVLYKIS